MLEVRLLGTFQVKQKKKSISIVSRPAQSLFAYLILSAGKSHRREKLAGMLWPDSLEQTARENLRHALWRLKKAFGSESAGRFIEADDLSIKFESSSEYWLDVAALEALDESSTADELLGVLAHYQGELLPGFYEEWVALEREHLFSLFEHHMARLMSSLESENRWLDILDWAERWIKLGQKPEPAYRALMLAHAAKGDISKVAATYERSVNSLKQFGVEPSPQTRALYEKLKAGKESQGTEEKVTSILQQSATPNTNVPIPITSFVGRERELEEALHLLSSTRLLTLTGTGGIGKTRLANHVARNVIQSYPGGVWWVELASVADENAIVQVVAHVLGVRESTSRTMRESLIHFLHEKRVLLVLDNCEHVIAACAQLADDLLRHCAELRILATSREALGILGETILQVPSLAFPMLADLSRLQDFSEFESLQLFAARASAIHPGLALTADNALAMTQICQRLDGIPLALELAAARVKMFSLDEIVARLDDRFNLLTQGNRTALPRHQTLRALIEWSDELLPESERILWRRISIFTGGWTLAAAESICADDPLDRTQILELLSHLVDKSIVIVEQQNGSTRFHMLETIRQYAQEKLQESDEYLALRLRHLEFFLQFTENAASHLLTVEQKKWFAELDSEYGNIRSALEWGMDADSARALRLTVILGQYWEVRGRITEGRSAVERALAKSQDIPKQVQAMALRWQAKFAARQGDYGSAWEPLEAGLKLSRALEDKPGILAALHDFGMVRVLQGNYDSAKHFYEESLIIAKEIDDKREIASLSSSLGNVASYTGDLNLARQYQEQSVRLFRELGDKFGLLIALNNLGIVLESQGDHAAARHYYEKSIATAYEIGEKNLVAYALNGLAHLLHLDGDALQANQYYRESLLISREIGEKRCIAYCLEGFAKIALRSGNAPRAARLLGAGETIRRAIGAPLTQAEQAELKQDLALAREKLGQDAFASLLDEGRILTMEQSIDLALEGIKP